MTSFLDQLRAGLAGWDLGGRRVLAAVSGGADSVAMLLGLCELKEEFQFELTAAHLDHMLRGEDSAADADWVKSLCESLNVPCVIERSDISASSKDSKTTLEESARKARYDFLERTALREGCTEIAVAHTSDDQAETVLHHIIRGSGLSGLRGIPRERILSPNLRIIRPLLDVRRTEIEKWLAGRGQDYRQDESNADPAFTRNRLRHQLLPVLESDYNPQVVPALNRLAQQAGELEDALDQLAEIYLQSAILERTPNRCLLDCGPLSRLPLAVRRVCLTLLWKQQNWPRQRMSFAHWNDLAELITKKRGALTLPAGVTAKRRKEGLIVEWDAG